MTRPGWHRESTRHSNAKKYGHAGGHYHRPVTSFISRFDWESRSKGKHLESLGKGIYRYITKDESSPTGYYMTVYNKNAGTLHHQITTDKDGVIPQIQAVSRFFDTEGRRNALDDLCDDATRLYDPKDKDAWNWYINPSKGDMKGIDTGDSSIHKIFLAMKGMKADNRKRMGKVTIIADSKEQEAQINHALETMVTPEEREAMGKLIIVVGEPTSKRTAGEYWRPENGIGHILVSDRYITPEVVGHEILHHVHATTAKEGKRVRPKRKAEVEAWGGEHQRDDEEAETYGEIARRT